MFCEKITHIDLSRGARMVVPPAPGYRRAAADLTQALAHAGCPDVVTVDDLPVSVAPAPAVPAIVLGNMMDSAVVRRLYRTLHDLTDRAWPGVGGWVVRGVPGSLPGLPPLLLAGVSDADDAPAAAAAVSAALAEWGTRLPILHRVRLGRAADLYTAPAAQFLQEPAQPWEQTGGSGDWDYMMLVARMGMLAVKTGIEALVPLFLDQVLRFADVRFFNRRRQDPIMVHGFLRHLLLPFALLEHHPAVDGQRRRRVLEALLALFASTEGAANASLLEDIANPRVRQNHGTRSAVDLYCGGRYFSQVHGLPEGLEWMALADRFFAPQLAAAKPVCDSWGHQWTASLYNTADYALLAGRDDYFGTDAFRQAADRALIAHSNVEAGPLHYLLMAAAVTGRREYLYPCRARDEEELIRRTVAGLGSDEPGRAWVTGERAEEPRRLLGVAVAPLDRLFYESIEGYGGFAPAGVYRRTVPHAETFDKISLRAGWDPDADYLLLDGVSGGSHSYQDAHCIVRFSSRGHEWLGGPRYGMWATGTVRDYTGVSVACDGAGPGCESRYARLRYCRQADTVDLVGTSLEFPGQSLWSRHILRYRDGLFLIVDEVKALRAGTYHVAARWYLRGQAARRDDGLMVTQGQARLVLLHQGSSQQSLEPIWSEGQPVCTCWRQELQQSLEAGQVFRIATLLWSEPNVDKSPSSRPCLEETDAGFRLLHGSGEETEVELEDPDAQLVRDTQLLRPAGQGSGATAVTAGGSLGVGPGLGVGLDTDQPLPAGGPARPAGGRVPGNGAAPVGVEVLPGRIRLPGTGAAVLPRAGAFRLRPRGLVNAWQHRGPGPVTVLADASSQARRAPGSGGSQAEGAPLCAVGYHSGAVEVLDGQGRLLQRLQAGTGPVRAVAWLADGDLVVGGDDAAVRRIGGDGRVRWERRIEWQPMSWEYWTRLHCGVLAMAAGELSADGHELIVAGCADRHLYAFSADGRRRWRAACEWGVPTSLQLAVLEPSAGAGASPAAEVLVGLSEPAIHGWCRVYGTDGAFRRALQRPDIVSWSIPSWVRVLRVADLTGDGRREVLTGLQTNHRQLVVYRGDGRLLWEADVGGAVLALEVSPHAAGGGGPEVCVGTDGGYVQCFAGSGERRWLSFLSQPVGAVSPRPDGGCLALRADGAVFALDEAGAVRGGWPGAGQAGAGPEPGTGALATGSRRAMLGHAAHSGSPGPPRPMGCSTPAGLVVGRGDGTVELIY